MNVIYIEYGPSNWKDNFTNDEMFMKEEGMNKKISFTPILEEKGKGYLTLKWSFNITSGINNFEYHCLTPYEIEGDRSISDSTLQQMLDFSLTRLQVALQAQGYAQNFDRSSITDLEYQKYAADLKIVLEETFDSIIVAAKVYLND
jgi:hypothetical protein